MKTAKETFGGFLPEDVCELIDKAFDALNGGDNDAIIFMIASSSDEGGIGLGNCPSDDDEWRIRVAQAVAAGVDGSEDFSRSVLAAAFQKLYSEETSAIGMLSRIMPWKTRDEIRHMMIEETCTDSSPLHTKN